MLRIGNPRIAPKIDANSIAKGSATQNGTLSRPYSANEVNRPTVYAPTAKNATKPRSNRPARPSVMLRPNAIRMYSATSAMTCAKKGPSRSGSTRMIATRTAIAGRRS